MKVSTPTIRCVRWQLNCGITYYTFLLNLIPIFCPMRRKCSYMKIEYLLPHTKVIMYTNNNKLYITPTLLRVLCILIISEPQKLKTMTLSLTEGITKKFKPKSHQLTNRNIFHRLGSKFFLGNMNPGITVKSLLANA